MTDHQGITNREKPKSQIAGKRTSNPRFPANPITSSAPNYQAFSGVRGFFTGDYSAFWDIGLGVTSPVLGLVWSAADLSISFLLSAEIVLWEAVVAALLLNEWRNTRIRVRWFGCFHSADRPARVAALVTPRRTFPNPGGSRDIAQEGTSWL
jgi:hypothetical protein